MLNKTDKKISFFKVCERLIRKNSWNELCSMHFTYIGKAKIPECNEKKIMKHVNGMYHAKYDTSKEAQEK